MIDPILLGYAEALHARLANPHRASHVRAYHRDAKALAALLQMAKEAADGPKGHAAHSTDGPLK